MDMIKRLYKILIAITVDINSVRCLCWYVGLIIYIMSEYTNNIYLQSYYIFIYIELHYINLQYGIKPTIILHLQQYKSIYNKHKCNKIYME